jgi:hypothetical protein
VDGDCVVARHLDGERAATPWRKRARLPQPKLGNAADYISGVSSVGAGVEGPADLVSRVQIICLAALR